MYFKFNPKYNPNRSRSRQTKSSDTSGGEQLQIDLILSVAGSRGEFIDGWLSSLSEYNPKIKWDIDELTGKSIISPTLLMFSHIEEWNLISECKNIFNEMNYDVNKKFSSTSHGDYLEYHINKEDLKNNKFRFILITQKKEHAPKIFWEALIKNLFPYSKNNTLDYHKKSSQEMFFHMKEEFYSWANNGKFLEEHADIIKNKINKLNIRPIEIEYEEIIKPSGSYYLQKKLNLNITEKDHKYWKEQLQKSHSPLEVECFGKIFRYEDLLC